MPYSPFGYRRFTLGGFLLLGVFIWEVFWQKNARRWQVWSVLPAAVVWSIDCFWRWTKASPFQDFSELQTWTIITHVLCLFSLLPYVCFAVEEHWSR